MSPLKKFIYTLLFLFIAGGTTVCAQKKDADVPVVITDTTDLDALFKKARDLSYANNNSQARKICLKILEKNPAYYDVRTFIGRTYAWDHMYDNARTELSRVLIEKEDDLEALSALIDVESWSGNQSVANDYLKIALGFYPTSEDLLLKKAKIQLQEEEKENASITLRKILDLNPGNKDALRMLNGLTNAKLNNRFQLLYSTDFFDKAQQPQKYFSAELGRSFNFGSIIGRIGYADKFNHQALQYELDSYIRFSKSNYIYLNGGISQSEKVQLFPNYRAAAEIFQKIPAGFELSLGIRYLQFNIQGPPASDSKTQIYTASLGNYFRNYWFNFRWYHTPSLKDGNDALFKKAADTYLLSIRNYFGDADNFIGMRAGRGQSPDERKLAEAITPRLGTYQAALEYQLNAFGRWLLKGELGYAREETRANYYQQRITVAITLRTIF